MSTSTETDLAAIARGALQFVCSGQLERLPAVYDAESVDHANPRRVPRHAAPPAAVRSTWRSLRTLAFGAGVADAFFVRTRSMRSWSRESLLSRSAAWQHVKPGDCWLPLIQASENDCLSSE